MLGDGGGAKIGAMFYPCDCYIGMVFWAEVFAEKLKLSLPGGRACLPL